MILQMGDFAVHKRQLLSQCLEVLEVKSLRKTAGKLRILEIFTPSPLAIRVVITAILVVVTFGITGITAI